MDEAFDMLDKMLKNSTRLRPNELGWVKKIDRTISRFKNVEFTPRQREVIQDIYRKFKERV